MTEPVPKDILGVPLYAGDCVAIAGANRGTLIVGNISFIEDRPRRFGYYIHIKTQAGRTTYREPWQVAFISRNPRGP